MAVANKNAILDDSELISVAARLAMQAHRQTTHFYHNFAYDKNSRSSTG